jgi:hypothetical protein
MADPVLLEPNELGGPTAGTRGARSVAWGAGRVGSSIR